MIYLHYSRYPVHHPTCSNTCTCITLVTNPRNCISALQIKKWYLSASNKYGLNPASCSEPRQHHHSAPTGSVSAAVYRWVSVSGYGCFPVYAHPTHFTSFQGCALLYFNIFEKSLCFTLYLMASSSRCNWREVLRGQVKQNGAAHRRQHFTLNATWKTSVCGPGCELV